MRSWNLDIPKRYSHSLNVEDLIILIVTLFKLEVVKNHEKNENEWFKPVQTYRHNLPASLAAFRAALLSSICWTRNGDGPINQRPESIIYCLKSFRSDKKP